MSADAPEERLESWKEIAGYLRRDVRTVQRWEKSEGLPVQRHFHDKMGSVFASKSDLDAWLRVRSLPAEDPAAEPEPDPPEPSGEGAAKDDIGRHGRKIWVLAALGAILLLAAALGLRAYTRHRSESISLAVLPFADLGGDPAQEFFSDGITEELITELSRQQGAGSRILAMGSSLSYKKSPKRASQIAAELGVDYVLEGTVRRSGDRVRIAVHLVRGRDEAHVWDDSYDRPLGDVLSLQAEVAENIAASITQRLDHNAVRAPRPPISGPALDAYLKGRFFWNKRTPADLLKALACFGTAAQMEARYAPIHAGIADCYALLGSAEMGVMAPNDALPKARAAALKALDLDPRLAEAHASLAYIRLIYDWDVPGAEEEFQRAIQLNPNYPTAHQWYALCHSIQGRTEDALDELRRAERLDPLSPTVKCALSECYYFARRYDEALASAKAALEIDPAFMLAQVNLGRALAQKGDLPGAVKIFAESWERSGKAPGLAMLLGSAYGRMGDRAHALAMLDALRHPPVYGGRELYVPSLYFAAIHAGLGETDQAFVYMDKALEERCEYLVYLGKDPMADGMRDDPRFLNLMRKVGLPVS